MASHPTIKFGGAFSSHFLEVKFLGVKFNDPNTLTFGARNFAYAQIDCVLLSPANVLTLQVGKENFSIPVKPDDPKHKAVLDALTEGLQRSLA